MKKTINERQFKEAFKNYNREDNFSREGLEALYNYLTRLEDDIGEEIELDVIALCGEFMEYESLEEYNQEYLDDKVESIDEIKNKTNVIEIPNSERFIIQVY